jgi:hypothetical protein
MRLIEPTPRKEIGAGPAAAARSLSRRSCVYTKGQVVEVGGCYFELLADVGWPAQQADDRESTPRCPLRRGIAEGGSVKNERRRHPPRDPRHSWRVQMSPLENRAAPGGTHRLAGTTVPQLPTKCAPGTSVDPPRGASGG